MSAPQNGKESTGASVPAKKILPPESPQAVRLRSMVILSFWAIIAFVGLPMWWKTTSIYRAQLPLQDMLNWSEGLVGQAVFPLQVWVSAPAMSCVDATRVLRETQQRSDDLNEFPAVHLRLRLTRSFSKAGKVSNADKDCILDTPRMEDPEPAIQIELSPGSTDSSFELSRTASKATVHFPAQQQSTLPEYLANTLRTLFAEEQVNLAHEFATRLPNSNHAQAFMRSVSQDTVDEISQRDTRAFKQSSTYHITFSLFTASGAPSSWSIDSALRTRIQPLIAAVANTANISITTQIHLYSAFTPSIQPLRDETRKGAVLRQEDLSAFVNAAEWPLSPSIGDGPTINFVMYIPEKDQIPLTIEGTQGTSWLVPQWGGITILNPRLVTHAETGVQGVPSHLNEELLDAPFNTFSAQLLSLLGVPTSHRPDRQLSLPLRFQAQKRFAALDLYLRASSTLGSLARLAQHLSSIPIPKHVAKLVDDTISHLTSATDHFQQSNWDSALAHAKMAFDDSEKAFFDKAMVGQAYFPDEHKVAVYLPLLGPIGVPLVVGLLREAKLFVTAMRSRKG